MAELARTIELRRRGDTAGAVAIIRTNRGKELMEGIRSVTAQMGVEERRTLAAHQSEWLDASRVSSLVTVGGAAFLLAFLVAAGFGCGATNIGRGRFESGFAPGKSPWANWDSGRAAPRKARRRRAWIPDRISGRVHAGAVYLEEPDGRFRRFAGCAVAGGPDLDLVRSGDGFLGQAAKENRALHLQEVPEGYVSVGSSLGRSKPIELFVAPASVDGVVYAVIELIFSRRLEAADHTLLARAFQSFGLALRTSKDRARLEEALETVEQQDEELHIQEEVLRVNRENLERQAHLEDSRLQWKTQQTELERTNLQLDQQALILKRQNDDLSMFNCANFSSIATDPNGVIQIFNLGAERMLGYTAEEVVNKKTPADLSDPHEVMARAKALSIEHETPISPGFESLVFKASRGIEDIYELTYIRKDGDRVPAIVSVTALRDEKGCDYRVPSHRQR